MKIILFLIISSISLYEASIAQSSLLDGVKQNPKEAKSLCNDFRVLNRSGKSASSKDSIMSLSKRKNLTEVDAEILSIYVIGLYCPEVY